MVLINTPMVDSIGSRLRSPRQRRKILRQPADLELTPLRLSLHNSEWMDSRALSPAMSSAHSYLSSHSARPDSQFTNPTLNSSPFIDDHKRISDRVSNWDVLWAIVSTVLGKDKLAKFGQYTLRLVLLHASDAESALANDRDSALRFADQFNRTAASKKIALVRSLARNPRAFARTILVLASQLIQTRLRGMWQGLGAFRHFLRFGKSPFKARALFLKLCKAIHFKATSDTLLHIDYPQLVNRTVLGEAFGLYYNLADDTSLLFRTGLLRDPSLRRFAARHEARAWYYDTLLALYNAYEKYTQLQAQETALEIQIQVKRQSRLFSRQVLSSISPTRPTDIPYSSPEDTARMREITFAKTNAQLDILKNLSDLVFNLYTVFDIPLPFRTLQIWMGISASLFSLVKMFRETRERLEKNLQ